MENTHTGKRQMHAVDGDTLYHILLAGIGMICFGSAIWLSGGAYFPSVLFGAVTSTLLVLASSRGGYAEDGEGPIMTVTLVAILVLIWSFVWLASGLVINLVT